MYMYIYYNLYMKKRFTKSYEIATICLLLRFLTLIEIHCWWLENIKKNMFYVQKRIYNVYN